MKANDNKLERIYRRTDGQYHICRKRLCFGNYGAIGKRGAWEIEHSHPRSKGGMDHLNNLYAAWISCNRSKDNGTTASTRDANGYRTAPLSKQQRSLQTWKWGAAGSLVALFVPPPLRLVAFVAGAAAGALLGHDSEPE